MQNSFFLHLVTLLKRLNNLGNSNQEQIECNYANQGID